MKHYLLLLILIVLASPISASYQDQADLENKLSSQAQHILNTMYGPHKIAAVARVSLGKEAWKITYTEKAAINKNNKEKDVKTREYMILPGFSTVQSFDPDERNRLPFNSEVVKIPAPIKKISIELIVSKDVSRAESRRAGKLLTKVLNLNADRGDEIIYTSQRFAVPNLLGGSEGAEHRPQRSDRFLLALIAIFILIYALLQSQLIKKLSSASKGAEAGPAASSAQSPSAIDWERPAESSSGKDSMKHYFDFIDKHNLGTLIELIKEEKLPQQHIAVIASFIQPELAGKFLRTFSEKEQAAIITAMANSKTLKQSSLDKLEEQIRSKLECTVGGGAIVSRVFSHLEEQQKKTLLQTIKKEPQAYQSVRSNVILFDDIRFLSPTEVSYLTSATNMDMLAAAVMGASKEARAKIMNGLSKSAKAMLKQFEELKGQAMTQGEIELAQSYILDILNRLEKEGRIKLRQKLENK